MINDITDPAPCTRTLAVPHDTLDSGAVVSADGTSVTLGSSASAVDGFYVNNIVAAISGPAPYGIESDLLVTSYTGSTRKATGTWSSYTPDSTWTYFVYSTVTIDTTVAGAASTITGYNTNFGADVAFGDSLYGNNPPNWSGFNASGAGAWVTGASVITTPSGSAGKTQTINHLVNSGAVQISSSIPQVYYRSPKWATGSCGWLWLAKHFDGNSGNVQPAFYPPNGGSALTQQSISSNNLLGHNFPLEALLFTLADYDSRAVPQASQYQLSLQDFGLSMEWNYLTGLTGSGVSYGNDVTTRFAHSAAWILNKNVAGYPDVGLNGPFTLGLTTWKTFSGLPDNPWTPNGRVNMSIFYGGGQSNNPGSTPDGQSMVFDHGQAANPTAAPSRYLKNFLQSVWGYSTVPSIPTTNLADFYAKIDPKIVSTDYTLQPLQYAFVDAATSVCSALSWWGPACNPAIRASAVLSRGKSWTDNTSSLLQYQARAFVADHDSPQPGTLVIWDTGCLRCSDQLPSADSGGGAADIIDSTPEFTGTSTLCPGMAVVTGTTTCVSGGGKTTGISIATIDAWAGGDHGTWATNYGDANSKYAYARGNLAGAYTTSYNHVIQHFAHFKKTDEIAILYHDIDSSNSPTQVAVHAPFPQNGETIAAQSYYKLSYDEGTTSYPGSGGCGNLNATRVVLEQQNGASDHSGPVANHNLIWNVVVPSGAPAVFVNCDSPPITVLGVTKTTSVGISTITTGFSTTTIQTSAPHNLISGEAVTLSGVNGTGSCSSVLFGSAAATVINSTTYTIPVNSTGCTGPSGGTSTSPTLFTAISHGLSNNQYVTTTGATGSWAAFNNVLQIQVADANHFSNSTDTSAYSGSFNGNMVAVYPGGQGHINRVSMCADSGNTGMCGASGQNGLEAIEVMKITTQPDTALTTTAINPDSNWTGAQINNAVVAMFARHGTTYGTITDFVTTHTGTAQYLIAGLSPGAYPVTVNGTPVTGSPFTVTGGTTGGNALEFEATSGMVHVNGSAPTCQISTTSLPGGTIGTPYSQTIATSNCTPNPPASNWTVATGSLCPGLTLNASTGTISGTPTGTATTCTFTIRVVDTVPTTATSGSLSISMTGGTVFPFPGAMTSAGSLSSGSRR